jgi:hypothetical protein
MVILIVIRNTYSSVGGEGADISNVKAGGTDTNNKGRKQPVTREQDNWRPLYLRSIFMQFIYENIQLTVNISANKQSDTSSLSNLLIRPFSEASNSLFYQLHEDLFVQFIT